MGREPERGEEGEAARFEVWVDAQLPPGLALWLREEGGVAASHVEDLGLLSASDSEIFGAAAESERRVVVITKDQDFATMVDLRGPPPQVVWLRCGNVSNSELHRIVAEAPSRAAQLLTGGERLVEVRSRRDVAS